MHEPLSRYSAPSRTHGGAFVSNGQEAWQPAASGWKRRLKVTGLGEFTISRRDSKVDYTVNDSRSVYQHVSSDICNLMPAWWCYATRGNAVCMWIGRFATHAPAWFAACIAHIIHSTQDTKSNQIIRRIYIWMACHSVELCQQMLCCAARIPVSWGILLHVKLKTHQLVASMHWSVVSPAVD